MKHKNHIWILPLIFLVSIIGVSAEVIYDFGTNKTTNDGFSVISYDGKPISAKFNVVGDKYVSDIQFYSTRTGTGNSFNVTIVNSTGNLPNTNTFG